MPQSTFEQYLQGKGLPQEAINSVLDTVKKNPQLMAKYAPRDNSGVAKFQSIPDYTPLSPLVDARNRILNGFITTGQGVLNVLPSTANLVLPEDSKVHQAMSGFINSVSSWDKADTESGKSDYDVIENPSLGNLTRGMGDLFGFILPIFLTDGLSKAAGLIPKLETEASATGILPAILGYDKAISARIPQLTAMYGQFLQGSMESLKKAGITGKNFDYMAPALAATGMLTAEVAFKGIGSVMDAATQKMFAKEALGKALQQTLEQFGAKDLQGKAFQDYSKALLENTKNNVLDYVKRFATSGVRGAATFAGFNALNTTATLVGENIYDRYHSDQKPGQGNFGAPDIESKQAAGEIFKSALSGALSGMLFEGGIGMFHPYQYDSMYNIVDHSVRSGDDSEINAIKQKVNGALLKGAISAEQRNNIYANIDQMKSSLQDFNQKFPEAHIPQQPEARKQLFDLWQQRTKYESLKANLSDIQNIDAKPLDPVVKESLQPDIEHQHEFIDSQIAKTNELMSDILKHGAFKNEESILFTMKNNYNKFHPNEPVEVPKQIVEDRRAKNELAATHGFKDTDHALNAYNKYVATKESGIPKIKKGDWQDLTEDQIKQAKVAKELSKTKETPEEAAAAEVSEEPNPLDEVFNEKDNTLPQDQFGETTGDVNINPPPEIKPVTNDSQNEDGLQNGEPKPEENVQKPGTEEAKLPKDLSGAKPRYSYGKKGFSLSFESDTDKALLIVAQDKKSKRDADFMNFLHEKFPSLSEDAIRKMGRDLKDRIKAVAKNSEADSNIHVARKNGEWDVNTHESTGAGAHEFSEAPASGSFKEWMQSDTPKTAKDVLNKLLADNPNAPYSGLLKFLIKHGDALGLNVKVEARGKQRLGLTPKTSSVYTYDTDTIHVSDRHIDNPGVIVHEIIHGLTVKKMVSLLETEHPEELRLATNDADLDAIYLKYAINGKNKALSDLMKIYSILKTHKAFEELRAQHGRYGLQNPFEFIAELFTNRHLQDSLNKVLDKSEKRTLWQKVVDAISRLLGIPVNENSFLDRALRNGAEIISMDRPDYRSFLENRLPNEHEYRDRDEDGIFLDPKIINDNNYKVKQYFDEPINVDHTHDLLKNISNMDTATIDDKSLSRFVQWANSNDDSMADLKPYVTKNNIEGVVEAMAGRPELATIINAHGGISDFADMMLTGIKKGTWAENPAHFSPLQRDIYTAFSYFRNLLKSPELVNSIELENPRSTSFLLDQFGTPMSIPGEQPSRDVSPLDRYRIAKNNVSKSLKGMTTEPEIHKGIATYVSDTISTFRGLDVTPAKKPMNSHSQNWLDETQRLANDPFVTTDIAHHFATGDPLSPEADDLFHRIGRLESSIQTKMAQNNGYTLSTGSYVDKTDMDAMSSREIDDTQSRRKKTEQSNPIIKAILNSPVAKWLHANSAIKTWNIETVGLKLFGSENNNAYKVFIRPLLNAQREKIKVASSIKDQVMDSWHKLRRGSTLLNYDKASNIKSEVIEGAGEEHKLTQAQFIHLYAMGKNADWLKAHMDRIDEDGDFVRGAGAEYDYTNAAGNKAEKLIHFNEEDFNRWEKIIQANPDYVQTYDAARRAFESGWEPLARQYKLKNGVELGYVENYVPTAIAQQHESLSIFNQHFIEDINRVKFRGKVEQPSKIQDIFSLVNRYADDVGGYVAWAEPLDNMTKFIENNGRSLREKGLGTELEYLDKYVTDMNDSRGGSMVDDSKLFNKLLSAFGRSRLLFNPSPDLKQGISYVMANQLVPAKYLRRYLPDLVSTSVQGHLRWKNGAGAEDVVGFWKQYSPMLYDRFMGNFGNIFSEANNLAGVLTLGEGSIYSQDAWGNTKRLIDFIQDKGMMGIRVQDTANNVAIQRAIFDMIQERFPGLERNSEEFNKKAAYYAEEVIRKTQHGYDPATKTPLQRSNNPITKALFLFTGQLQKQLNLMTQSYLNLLYDPSGANLKTFRNYLVNVGIYNSYWVGAVTLMNAGWSGYTKKDDDLAKELFFESSKEFLGNFPMMNLPAQAIFSRVDQDKWQKDITLPQFDIMNQAASGVADFYKAKSLEDSEKSRKYFTKGVDETVRLSIQGLGLPYKVYDLIVPKASVQK